MERIVTEMKAINIWDATTSSVIKLTTEIEILIIDLILISLHLNQYI